MPLDIIERDTAFVRARLRIVRRHSSDCIDPATGKRTSEEVDCPAAKRPAEKCVLWVRGTVNKTLIQESLGTRRLATAIQKIAEQLDNLEERHGRMSEVLTVTTSIERYLKEKIAVSFPGQPITLEEAIFRSDTFRKYNDLLRQLKDFALKHGIQYIGQFTTDHLSDFRDTWRGAFDAKTGTYRPKSLVGKQKCQESLRAFFTFAMERGWITNNPAKALSPIGGVTKKRRTPHKPGDSLRMLDLIPSLFPKTTNMVRAFLSCPSFDEPSYWRCSFTGDPIGLRCQNSGSAQECERLS